MWYISAHSPCYDPRLCVRGRAENSTYKILDNNKPHPKIKQCFTKRNVWFLTWTQHQPWSCLSLSYCYSPPACQSGVFFLSLFLSLALSLLCLLVCMCVHNNHTAGPPEFMLPCPGADEHTCVPSAYLAKKKEKFLTHPSIKSSPYSSRTVHFKQRSVFQSMLSCCATHVIDFVFLLPVFEPLLAKALTVKREVDVGFGWICFVDLALKTNFDVTKRMRFCIWLKNTRGLWSENRFRTSPQFMLCPWPRGNPGITWGTKRHFHHSQVKASSRVVENAKHYFLWNWVVPKNKQKVLLFPNLINQKPTKDKFLT